MYKNDSKSSGVINETTVSFFITNVLQRWYDYCYTVSMKTTKAAISIPVDTFDQVEKAIKRLKTTRSRFYAEAAEERLKRMSDKAVTENLNKVYKDVDSSLDPAMKTAARRAIMKDPW